MFKSKDDAINEVINRTKDRNYISAEDKIQRELEAIVADNCINIASTDDVKSAKEYFKKTINSECEIDKLVNSAVNKIYGRQQEKHAIKLFEEKAILKFIAATIGRTISLKMIFVFAAELTALMIKAN